MRKFICSFFVALSLLTSFAVADTYYQAPYIVVQDELEGVQVPIPKEDRVKNKTGIQCVWCTIECLGRYHGVEQVINLTDKYKNKASDRYAKSVLDSLKVNYIMLYQGSTDKKFLIDVCEKGWGASVGLNSRHQVNLVHFKDGVVKIIDNSDPQLRIQTWTEQTFMQRWDGWAISLVPVKNRSNTIIPLGPRSPSTIK